MNHQMLRQAQQIQERLGRMQEELEGATVEATSGGGVVSVVVTGKQKVRSVKINPEAVDPMDVELLEELVLAAINEGLQKSQELAEQKLGSITGGLKHPGF